jgi:alpha-1,3-rhamnosyl/mannosyltransferase
VRTRVAVDGSGLYVAQAGVARYIRGLLRGLRALDPPDLEIHELAWPVTNFGYRQPGRALKTVYREWIWAKLIAPRYLRRARFGLFHSTGSFIVRPPPGVVAVATLHDLAGLRYPERFRRWHRISERRRLKRLHSAARVICISAFTAREAISLLGLASERIRVIHNGVDFAEGNPSEAPPSVALPPEFFLFVGSLEPGKNLALLQEVYGSARERGARLPPLVVVGARWAGVAGEGSPPADWHYLGRQPDEVLVYLYRRALALCFPSKYEGFGLPVAEGLGLGCPVICSRVASVPEVGGDAALYADLDPGSYWEAMSRVAGDSALRAELREKGRAQAAQFSWRRCAEQVVGVYREVAAETGGTLLTGGRG